MESIQSQSQQAQGTHDLFSEYFLRNPIVGFFIIGVMACIYLFKAFEHWSKKKPNKVIPHSTAFQRLEAKKMKTQDRQIQIQYREKLLKDLQHELNQRKDHGKQKQATLKSKLTTKLTMYELYTQQREVKMSVIQERNQKRRQDEQRKRQIAKDNQRKLQQAKLAEKQKEQSLKIQKEKSQAPQAPSIIPSTRVKIPSPEQTKPPADLKPKDSSSNLFGTTTDNSKKSPIFGGSIDNSLFGPSKPEPKVEAKKDEKPIAVQPLNFASLTNQANSLFNIAPPNVPKPPESTPQGIRPAQTQPQVPAAPPSPPPVSLPIPSAPAPSAPSANSVPPAARRQKLTALQFLDTYQQFVQNLGEDVTIGSKIQDLLGARSLTSEILTEAKTLINSIDKSDDKQLTSFAKALYHNIIFQFINKSNVKSNLERIPPKSRTDQCEKNSINKYALTVNIYRLMGPCKRVWLIVFGKLLKLLDFLYKRHNDLESYHKLELIQNGYIKKYKEVHSKYLSRLDFLTYMLFALTSFDPILIFRQIEEKEKDAEKTRLQIESWGNTWSYAEFWALCSVLFANQHQSYSKPIVYINLLYTLYPRIYQNKRTPALFKEQNELYAITLQKSKKYMEGFKTLKEVKTLSECDQNEQMNYEFDGQDFVKSIKVLDNRIAEKATEFRLKSFKEFEAKANIFYYFTKEK